MASSAGQGPYTSAYSRRSSAVRGRPARREWRSTFSADAQRFLVSTAQVRDSAERPPCAGEAGMIFRGLEQWDSAKRELLDFLDPRLGRDVRAVVGRDDSRDRLARSISQTIRAAGRRTRQLPPRSPAIAGTRSRTGRARARYRAGARASARASAREDRGRRGCRPARARAGRRRPIDRPPAVRAPDPTRPALACSGLPAPGGSRGSRPARPYAARARSPIPRSARAGPLASTSGELRTSRPGSGGGGTETHPRQGTTISRGGSAPCEPARRGVA